MRTETRYERLGWRYRRFFLPVIVVSLLILAVTGLYLFLNFSPERILRVVLVASPTSIISFDREKGKLVILAFPAQAQISAVYGVGQYSLEALWRLGQIDPADRLLLSQSLEEAASLPLPYYLGVSAEALPAFTDPVTSLRQTFSVSNIWPFILGRYRTNLNFPLFLSLTRALSTLRPDDITVKDVSATTVLRETLLPDGTKASLVDPDRLSLEIGTTFEDERIRREAIHVAIFNTTSTTELGSRVARLLNHLGANVISVGNSSPAVDRCEVVGKAKILTSETAKFMLKHYACRVVESQENIPADLVLRLGRAYEARFRPRK